MLLNLDHPELLLRRGTGRKAGFWKWWHFSFFRTKLHRCLLDWATSGLTVVSLQSLMGWSVTAAHQLMNGQTTVIELYSGILSGKKKGWSCATCYDMDKPWKHYVKWEKPDTTGYALWVYSWEIPRLGKSIETGSRLVVARGWRKGRMGSDC